MLLSAIIVIRLIRFVGNLTHDEAVVQSRTLYHHVVLFAKLGIAMFEEEFLTWKIVIAYSLLPMWFVVSHTVGFGPWNMSANGTEGAHKKVGERYKQQPVQVTKKFDLGRIFSNMIKQQRYVQHNSFSRAGNSLGDQCREKKKVFMNRTNDDLEKLLKETIEKFGPEVT